MPDQHAKSRMASCRTETPEIVWRDRIWGSRRPQGRCSGESSFLVPFLATDGVVGKGRTPEATHVSPNSSTQLMFAGLGFWLRLGGRPSRIPATPLGPPQSKDELHETDCIAEARWQNSGAGASPDEVARQANGQRKHLHLKPVRPGLSPQDGCLGRGRTAPCQQTHETSIPECALCCRHAMLDEVKRVKCGRLEDSGGTASVGESTATILQTTPRSMSAFRQNKQWSTRR